VRALPVAPRPFHDEALGSWIGRLAGRYRIAVEQLDRVYGLGLTLTGPLAWLLPEPVSDDTQERLKALSRTARNDIKRLTVDATGAAAQRAAYCQRCVFLNPLEVESPYWKREWLSPESFTCAVHAVRLVTLPAWRVRRCENMLKLIRTVGRYERARRENWLGERH